MEEKIKYLVDTNVWLELLLQQERAGVAFKFFDITLTNKISISDFSLHSIGVILSRLDKFEVLEKIVEDLFVNGNIRALSLKPEELKQVVKNIQKYDLDFDDAYQLTVSDKNNLTIVTFDKDFKMRELNVISPEEAISED